MPQMETLPARTWPGRAPAPDPLTTSERIAAVREALELGADPCDLPLLVVLHATPTAVACGFCGGRPVMNGRSWIARGGAPYAECPRCGEVSGFVGTVTVADRTADEFTLEDFGGRPVALRWSCVSRLEEHEPADRG